jgi:HSP20 family protein
MNGLDGGQVPDVAASGPAVNMWEDAESVHVEAELPGLAQEDMELYVTGGNQFTIIGERKEKVPEKGISLRQERRLGRFVRVVTLPMEVDRDKVEARLENGILLVKLAKQEASKPRQIVVTGQ